MKIHNTRISEDERWRAFSYGKGTLVYPLSYMFKGIFTAISYTCNPQLPEEDSEF